MKLIQHEVHIWIQDLKKPLNPVFLSKDEEERAARFKFEIHRKRFIAARNTLRHILSLYLDVTPQEIVFAYSAHHKPYLNYPNDSRLLFNLSHSHDIAIYAITLNHQIGIDIEKVEESDKFAIAKRFFSIKESEYLATLTGDKKITAFYQLWATKEALIKAVGKGLSLPLSSFTVLSNQSMQNLKLENQQWTVLPLIIDPQYQAALASNQMIKTISYWKFSDQQQPILDSQLQF